MLLNKRMNNKGELGQATPKRSQVPAKDLTISLPKAPHISPDRLVPRCIGLHEASMRTQPSQGTEGAEPASREGRTPEHR